MRKYYVFAPCGLTYGPVPSIDSANKIIDGHSLYPGEPHWTIEPSDCDVAAVVAGIDARMEAESRARLAKFENESSVTELCGREM